MANLAEKFSVGSKLKKLRRARRIRRADRITTRKNENVTFGIDSYARYFSKVKIRGEFQKIRDRVVANFRWLLGENGSSKK